ncbi:MAG: PIG-L family deacetylase [Acidobacteria bacterium]|nr:PIG-L family deacetylase [Acidobacteriota bacterium]
MRQNRSDSNPKITLNENDKWRIINMDRRRFIGSSVAGSALFGHPQTRMRDNPRQTEVLLERDQSGQPHQGKVLAAIQPHCDDLPLFAGGTILKLIREGYTGILIRTSNDEMAGRGATVGDVVRNNETDNLEVARRLGLSRTFDLNYRNHEFDAVAAAELRHRLIFIFRLMKVDTVICYDPWGLYEENPDHYVTARCVEAACWMAGGEWDLPEHFVAGIRPSTTGQPDCRHQFLHRSEDRSQSSQCHPGPSRRERRRSSPPAGRTATPTSCLGCRRCHSQSRIHPSICTPRGR